jgi:hypothetical protein
MSFFGSSGIICALVDFYEAEGFTLDQSRPEQNHNGDPSLVEVRYRKVFADGRAKHTVERKRDMGV